MVEYASSLDTVFGSLADATRRDILRRVAKAELSIGEIAAEYDMTFAAISKHIQILQKAKLIIKQKRGKEQFVQLAPHAFANAQEYLEWYQQLWENRFDSLDNYLKEQQHGKN